VAGLYLESEELHDPLVIVLVSVDGNEQKLSLVFLGDGPGNFSLKKNIM